MMEPTSSRPVRKVAIADHLWEAFAEMAQAMGSDRDALVNQAMFMFARLNGFLESGGAARAAVAPRPASAARLATPPVTTPSSPPVAGYTPTGLARAQAPEPRSAPPVDMPARKQVAERVLETAAELERLIQEQRDVHGDTVADVSASALPPIGGGVDSLLDGVGTGAETVNEGSGLHLLTEGGEAVRIGGERFVIGRGKHCDYVIHSSKVSREHAAITREGEDYFIEDLDSSNGTWFNKQRIKRRKVEPGDEYFICSERIRLVVR